MGLHPKILNCSWFPVLPPGYQCRSGSMRRVLSSRHLLRTNGEIGSRSPLNRDFPAPAFDTEYHSVRSRTLRQIPWIRESGKKNRGLAPNLPSLKAVQKSCAEPITSSARLLKLFPNDGPTWLLNSSAATSRVWLMTTTSHSFVGRKWPGSVTTGLRRWMLNEGNKKTDKTVHVFPGCHTSALALVHPSG